MIATMSVKYKSVKRRHNHEITFCIVDNCLKEINKDEKYCLNHKYQYRLQKPDNCAICLDIFENDIKPLRCGHYFHEKCINKMREFEIEYSCPMCRDSLISDEISLKINLNELFPRNIPDEIAWFILTLIGTLVLSILRIIVLRIIDEEYNIIDIVVQDMMIAGSAMLLILMHC
jgi:hypothetical protein